MKIKHFWMFFLITTCLIFVLSNYSPAKAEWYFETVGVGCSGSNTSIALESNGNQHINYFYSWVDEYFYRTDVLKYADYDCNWHYKQMDSDAYLGGTNSSLALDSNGSPHISYYTRYCNHDWPASGRCTLDYDYYDGTSWHYDQIETWGVSCGCFQPLITPPSLCLDSNDKPHISYTYNGNLYYAYYNGDWFFEIVDSSPSSLTSITLDSGNNPHISYRNTEGNLKYGYFDGIWHTEVVDIADCSQPSLIIDSNDNPHVGYYDATNLDIKYAHHDGNNWQIEIIDHEGDVGQYNAMDVDNSNHLHISYYDATNGDLKYAYHDGNSWHIETVDHEGDVGRFTSLALGNNNIPHISYCDTSNDTLKYAHLPCPYDFDCDGFVTEEDNCPDIANPCQEDTCPPQGNEIGDACDCEGDFDCDQDQDGGDAATFKIDFGRSSFNNPCEGGDLCNGDFDCDNDCDGTDAALFKQDFGRSQYNDPCPACETGMWCLYEGDPFIKDYSDTGCLGGSSQSSSDQEGICANEDRVTAGVMGNSIIVASSIYGNCCSGIEVELTVDGNDLHLFMMENPPGTCFCTCCFGVETEVAGLAADEYTIEMCWYDWGSGYSCETETVLVP